MLLQTLLSKKTTPKHPFVPQGYDKLISKQVFLNKLKDELTTKEVRDPHQHYIGWSLDVLLASTDLKPLLLVVLKGRLFMQNTKIFCPVENIKNTDAHEITLDKDSKALHPCSLKEALQGIERCNEQLVSLHQQTENLTSSKARPRKVKKEMPPFQFWRHIYW